MVTGSIKGGALIFEVGVGLVRAIRVGPLRSFLHVEYCRRWPDPVIESRREEASFVSVGQTGERS